MKTVLVLAAALILQASSQSCGSSSGPLPLKLVTSLPEITCDKPYTAQFILGGTQPYTVTIPSNPGMTWNGKPITDATFLGIGFSKAGGGFSPMVVDKPVQTTGYIVGTVPCSVLGNSSNTSLALAGAVVKVNKS